MTKRLIVAVDIDDVIFKTVAICQSEYEKRYGVFVPASECYSKDPVVWGVGDYPDAAKRLYQIFTASAPCCFFLQKQLRSGVSAPGGIPLLCQ